MQNEFFERIAELRNADAQIDALKAKLKPWTDYRDQLVDYMVAYHLKDYRVGTHPFALPDGSVVEYTKGENVKVLEERLPVVFDQMIDATDRPNGAPYTDEQVRALRQLHKLVVWKPSLDTRQWDKLPDDMKKLFEQALLRSAAKPSVAIKDPK